MQKNIIILRDEHRAKALIDAFEKMGVVVQCLQTLQIKPVLQKSTDFNLSVDLLIFTSVNAVNYSLPLIDEDLRKVRAIAIGLSTAGALKKAGFSKIIYPPTAGSDAILSLPEINAANVNEVLLFTGRGGVGKLQAGLKQRNINFVECIVYERVLAKFNAEKCLQTLVDIIIVPSVDALEGLTQNCSPDLLQKIKSMGLITFSQRITQEAKNKGFSRVVTASEKIDEIVLAYEKVC